jgi:hypothetical protein
MPSRPLLISTGSKCTASGELFLKMILTIYIVVHGSSCSNLTGHRHRELSPPALSSEDADRQVFVQPPSPQSTKSSSSSGPTKRRSRMSTHTFPPPTIFKSSHTNTNTLPKTPVANAVPLPPLPPPHPHQQPVIPPGPESRVVVKCWLTSLNSDHRKCNHDVNIKHRGRSPRTLTPSFLTIVLSY